MNELDPEQLLAEMRGIMRDREEHVLRNYPAIRETYRREYGWPELDPVRHGACLCIALGLHQAAITLANHLLESLLKYVLIYRYSHGAPPDEEKVREHATEVMVGWLAELLGGYPDWSAFRRNLEDFAAGLSENQRKARLIGKEIDAALDDPRWLARAR